MESNSVHVDADGLIDHTARTAALASDSAACVAELRDGRFGRWWRDGRSTGLDGRLAELAERLAQASSGMDEIVGGIRRQAAVVVAADELGGRS